MKSVIRVLQRPFGQARVEFFGGVRVGKGGIPLDVLREHFRRHLRHRQLGGSRSGRAR